ncbi:PREDICTED: putative FBD-associated F-box protein At3g50710 [Camelina sativa]|uniref:FBD-associated F-box protein At3g50710 n=1 Tax=Camelina sativa TaxID=90675 RepID=A0ABM0V5N9_CAMSA|nr:PREDICTED: putative FBD-associated F-box protein At3g50710 [Camelina sativa]
MDRISNLSDDLLLKILSQLPTKDVVETMFLSKRWKFLWTMVPKLDFDDGFYERNGIRYTEDSFKRFRQYVDRFMVLHKSPRLETLKFNLGTLSSTDDMETWIRIAIVRQVRELEINRFPADDDNSFILPMCLYTFENLVVLKLYRTIILDVPWDLEVTLSSLKTLHLLSVQYMDDESHRNLLAGCPVLKELVVDKSEHWSLPFFSVIMPSLERLSILDVYIDENYSAVERPPVFSNNSVVINVPSLKYLNYVDIYDFGHLCSSKNMPEVVEANVKLVCQSPEKLMRSLTSVKHLSLCLYGSMLQHRIEFYQLVHLELCGCSPKWWDLLTWMLESSPKLQVLKLNKCEERIGSKTKSIEGHWGQPSSVPECLLSHLNNFEWEKYNGRREEKKVVAYILKNARMLKTAAIFYWGKIPTRKRKELISLPRASGSCQLLLDKKERKI